MTIIFTPEELEYIDKKPFNWALKGGAPEEIAKSVKEKLALLNGEKGHNDGGPGSGNWGHEGREGEVGGSAPGDSQQASKTAKEISSIIKNKASDADSFETERKIRKAMEAAATGESFFSLYGGKVIEYRKKNSYTWERIESFSDGREDEAKEVSTYMVADHVANGEDFCETKADGERILKKTRSENLAGTKNPAKKDLDKLNEICAKHSSAQFRTGDSNEIRKNAREEAASEMASVLDGMEDGTVLYYNNESRNGPGWFTYAIKKDGNTWKYVEPNTGTTEDTFGTSAEVSQNFMEYHRNLGFSTDYESAQENKKALDKRISDLNSTPVDMSDAKASKEVHAPQDGKITYNSPDFGKPGKYVMYRQGNLGNNSMMFFAPMKEGADLYASARSLGDEGPTGQYEVEIKNPLIIKGGGDSECINKAYAALHPDKPKLVQNGSQWKKADAANASALNKSEYDAIIYIINGKPSEIQVTKKRIKDVKKTGSYTTTEWSRIGLTMEEAKRKGFYDRDPHDYERVDGRFDSDDNDFDPDDLYYFLKDWKLKRSENEDGGPGSGNFGHKGVKGQVGGSAPSDSSKRSVSDFYPKDSYKDNPEYKKLAKAGSEAAKKRQEAFSKMLELEKKIKKESEPYDLNEEDVDNRTDEEFTAFATGKKPRRLTERGKELKAEYDKISEEWNKQSEIEEDADEQLRIAKQEASVKQMEDYCTRKEKEPELKKAESNDYEGFTLDTTGTSFGDEYLENGKGFIAEMSPKEYLERCAFEIFDNGTFESTLNGAQDENVQKYAEQMKNGEKFDLPWLNYKDNGQEGRHRALAAYLNGIDKMPVLIIGNPPKKQDLRNIYRSRRRELSSLKEDRRQKKEPKFELPDDLLIEDYDLGSVKPRRINYDCDKDYKRALANYFSREDADDDDGRWVTTRDGNHLFINEEGEPEKGNPYVLAAAKGDKPKDEKKPDKPKILSKKALNDDISAIMSSSGEYADKRKKIEDTLRQLPKGSKVRFPDSWVNDNGKVDVAVWTGNNWAVNGGWEKKDGYSLGMDEMLDYFTEENPNERPQITSVAETEEQKRRYAENAEKANWRRKATVWADNGSFTDTMTIKMRKLDLDNCGTGIIVKGPDGREYVKDYDYERGKNMWFDRETWKRADMRTLSNPTFTGDFFDVNFGMNGLSADQCAKARQIYSSMPDEMKSKYENIFRSTTFEPAPRDDKGNQQCSHFNTMTGKVRFDDDATASTVFHECAHAFDRGAVSVDVDLPGVGRWTIESASEYLDYFARHDRSKEHEDFRAMAKFYGFETDGLGWFSNTYGNLEDIETQFKLEHIFTEKSREFKDVDGYSEVADAVSGLTENLCLTHILYGGHETSYWRSSYGGHYASPRSKEYWANFCSLKARRCDKALKLLKQITPNMYEAAENAYKEAFKHG